MLIIKEFCFLIIVQTKYNEVVMWTLDMGMEKDIRNFP